MHAEWSVGLNLGLRRISQGVHCPNMQKSDDFAANDLQVPASIIIVVGWPVCSEAEDVNQGLVFKAIDHQSRLQQGFARCYLSFLPIGAIAPLAVSSHVSHRLPRNREAGAFLRPRPM
jgi:hypothetical protein